MSDIFISYKREEQLQARRLAEALRQEGWSVWWDPNLRAGQHFDDVIEKALKEAKCVIVMWSGQSVQSQYVRDEARYAMENKKLIPVRIENVNLPFRFSGLQTLSLQDWDGSREFTEFRRLVDDIYTIVGAGSTADGADEHLHPEAGHRRQPRAEQQPIRKLGARLHWNRHWVIGAIAAVAVLAIIAYSMFPVLDIPLNISGVWRGETGRYIVTHEGNSVIWDGTGIYGNQKWHHRGTGTVEGYTIRGLIEELPDSAFPGYTGGSKVEGTIGSRGETISWTGMNPQERVWQRE
jgi:hypothetical protein